MKRRLLLKLPEERFYRGLDRALSPHRPFVLSDRTLLCGKRRGRRFFLYEKSAGVFPLFSCTLMGRVEKDADSLCIRYRFARPRLSGLIWLIWCALLWLSALSLIGTEPWFSLLFLLPALALTLPLFLFSSAKKARLLAALQSLAEPRGDGAEKE